MAANPDVSQIGAKFFGIELLGRQLPPVYRTNVETQCRKKGEKYATTVHASLPGLDDAVISTAARLICGAQRAKKT